MCCVSYFIPHFCIVFFYLCVRISDDDIVRKCSLFMAIIWYRVTVIVYFMCIVSSFLYFVFSCVDVLCFKFFV